MLEENQMYVIETDGSIHELLFCGDSDWEEKATTSIQELKNKVIDDMEKAILDRLPVVEKDKNVSLIGCVADVCIIVGSVAKQLKDGGKDE